MSAGSASNCTRLPWHTDYEQRNLTLTLDEDLLRAARKIATDRNTSVNQLVREFLRRLVQETDSQKAALAQVEEIFRISRIQVGKLDWTREDLHGAE